MLKNLKLKLFLFFLIFNFSTPIYAIDVSIRWTPNNESNLAGYKVFVREEGQSYNYKNPYWETIDNFCTIHDLDETKTYYFMVRAFGINEMESANSEEVLLIEGVPENDVLKKQLKEIISRIKSIKEEQETKRDFVIQKISNKDFSKINSEAVNGDSDTKKQEIIFKVQILALSTRLQKTSQQFRSFKNISEYIHNGLYKYTIGNHKDLKSASALQSELRSKGFDGAFVVAFKNGIRITVRDAKKFLTAY
jgi:hypothetical protein